MARVTHVKSARKAQGSCRRCGKAIKKGDAYKHFSNRIGRSSQRKVFCADCPIRPSDQTTSDKLASLYLAQESAQDTVAMPDIEVEGVADALDECAGEVRQVAEDYRESAQNIEDGFGHRTEQCDEIEQKADECDDWAAELEEAAQEVRDEETAEDAVSRADEVLAGCPL